MITYLMLLETDEDRERFCRLYENNWAKMYHVTQKMLKQRADIENAIHGAFLNLAEYFERYATKSDEQLGAMCITIAKNEAINILRTENHYTELELDELKFSEEEYGNPEVYVEIIELQEWVREGMKQLGDLPKETLILKYYHELSNHEIAVIQKSTTKSVEMRLFRAKKKLKGILNETKK